MLTEQFIHTDFDNCAQGWQPTSNEPKGTNKSVWDIQTRTKSSGTSKALDSLKS